MLSFSQLSEMLLESQHTKDALLVESLCFENNGTLRQLYLTPTAVDS